MEIIEVNTVQEKPDKGVLLLALGSAIYGNMALNLAVSIKKTNPNVKIALVHSGSSIMDLSDQQKFVFNRMIACPEEYMQLNGLTCYIKAKCYLNELTPFKRTLFLDSDMLLSPYTNLETVFAKYEKVDFTMANRGDSEITSGYSDWINLEHIKNTFRIDRWIDLSSEWIYFNNSCDKFFKKVQENYEDETLLCRAFAGCKPDEPAYSLAMIQTGIKPHIMPYYPCYWEVMHKHQKEEDIMKNYLGISMGGRQVSVRMQKIYNNLSKHYAYHTGIPVFAHINKNKVLKERQLI